ncbi:MAG TPA: hypothetical protein VF676_03230 [Flavobacterium sp.]|jgi:hypothetical protein
MKRTLSFIGIYFCIIFLSQACEPNHITISDIRFSALKLDSNGYYGVTNTFTDEIVFGVKYVRDDVSYITFDLSTKAYATTVPQVIDNPLLVETFSLSFAQPFVHNDIVIPADQNILSIPEIRSQILIDNETGTSFKHLILFSQDFNNSSEFINDSYHVVFKCETSDGRLFEKSTDVIFDL